MNIVRKILWAAAILFTAAAIDNAVYFWRECTGQFGPIFDRQTAYLPLQKAIIFVVFASVFWSSRRSMIR